MSRVATAIDCSEKDRKELERLSNSRTDEARRVERAQIIMGCLAGRRNDEVAAQFGIEVGTWRRRFASEGLAGLRDRPRPGKPVVYPAERRQRLLKQLETPPPAGLSGWDGGTLAQALGVSDDAVWRILRKKGIQLRRHRSWCVSTDPEFSTKAADIIGLYLRPPQNAFVISVDEKPSIQALNRSRHAASLLAASWRIWSRAVSSALRNLPRNTRESAFTGNRKPRFGATHSPLAVSASPATKA